jgi:hypothetical protein
VQVSDQLHAMAVLLLENTWYVLDRMLERKFVCSEEERNLPLLETALILQSSSL